MSRYIARQDPSTATPLLHALQHHRGKLHDYTQEFKKLQQSIQSAREHAELLESVRRDIKYTHRHTHTHTHPSTLSTSLSFESMLPVQDHHILSHI